jgi:hypothetical protein
MGNNSLKGMVKVLEKNHEGELVYEFERDYKGYIMIDISLDKSKKKMLRINIGTPQTVAELLKKYSVEDRKIIRKRFRINVKKNTAVRKKEKEVDL